MSETKTLHRNFWVWEFEKEERWLNEMAQEGWALQNAGFCTYTFEKTEPGQYITVSYTHLTLPTNSRV